MFQTANVPHLWPDEFDWVHEIMGTLKGVKSLLSSDL